MGKQDREQVFTLQMEDAGGSREGVAAFSSYFGGMATVSPDFVRGRLDELTDAGNVLGPAIVQAMAYLPADESAIDRVEKLLGSGRVAPAIAEGVLMRGKWVEPLTPDQFLRLLRAIRNGRKENTSLVMDFIGMWLHLGQPLAGDLAEFAWGCLEDLGPATFQERWDHDRVAAQLAPSDPERAFRLLEALLAQPYDTTCWNPIEGSVDHALWDFLKGLDPVRTFGTLLRAAASSSRVRMRLQDDIGELVSDTSDAEALLEVAQKDQPYAVLAAASASLEHPGFWVIAFGLLEAFPDDEALRAALSTSVQYGQGAIMGPLSTHMENRAQEVERVLNEASTPVGLRGWLSRLAAGLRRAAERERTDELDREANW